MHRSVSFLMLAACAIVATPFQFGGIAVAGNSPVHLQTAKSKPVLALDLGGLRLVNTATGATRSLSFGMKEADVLSVLTNLRGRPRNRGVNEECGAGPLGFAQWKDGLTLQFQNDRFVGWSVNDRSPGSNRLTTIAGIGVASTRTALQTAYTVTVSQTSLGTEFTAGQLGGLLSSTRQNARVTDLWSGTTCNFR
jgi:hypothetical protein